MSGSTFNPRGAVDLSALAASRKADVDSAQARAAAPAGTIVDVSETTFELDVMARSNQVPVIVDFWAAWSQPSLQLSPILERLTAEYAGRIVLAKIDADKEQRIAAAFQVQNIPAVFLVIKGQVQPLFQGAAPEAQIRQVFDQVVKVADQVGLSEEMQPGEVPAPPPVDPRYERAFSAVEAGDWDGAISAYEELLRANPADEDAKAGIAQVALLKRTEGIDPVVVAGAAMATSADRLLAADALILLGQAGAAFDRLLAGFSESAGDERDAYRERLLELFLLIGDSEEVRQARRQLTNLMF